MSSEELVYSGTFGSSKSTRAETRAEVVGVVVGGGFRRSSGHPTFAGARLGWQVSWLRPLGWLWAAVALGWLCHMPLAADAKLPSKAALCSK